MRLETKLESLLPAGNGPFNVTAFELAHDGESWSVNTPFHAYTSLRPDPTAGKNAAEHCRESQRQWPRNGVSMIRS